MHRRNTLRRYSDGFTRAGGKSSSDGQSLCWPAISPSDHFVQVYESDPSLVDAVSRFIGTGLESGDACIVIATDVHRQEIEDSLARRGIDLLTARSQGQYVALDAAETLAGFMHNGLPERRHFMERIGDVVARAEAQGKHVRAFGEMVALLWCEGNQAAAIRLEELWNELAQTRVFCLFCAYSMDCFGSDSLAAPFEAMCAQHSHVIPAESFNRLSGPEEQLQEIARLQLKARALEAEIAYRKEVEQALSQRESELADFFDNASEGIHKVGPDGTILWANKAELALLGYEPEEYIGHSIMEFHVDRDVILDMLAKLRRGETLYNHPARLRCKDGSIRQVHVHSNVCFENGQFLYTRCFTRDVTPLKEAEILQQRLAAIVDSSNDAIIGKSLDGIIVSWNKGAERIFGYPAGETIGQPETMLFSPDRLDEEDQVLARLCCGDRVEPFESQRVRNDGESIDVSLTISPIRDGQRKIIGTSTIARDITESKRQQRELADLNRRLKRAMTETHHRIKNNLQVVAAMIEMQALEHKGSCAVPLEKFDRLSSHICSLAIVHDLLTNRLKETEDAQFLSIKAVLSKLLPMLQQTSWGQAVHFKIADAEIPVKQCSSLALVLNELVSNAIKHGKGETEVTFAIEDGRAVLEVCDNGPGFPPDFDPFLSGNTGLEVVESLVSTDLVGRTCYENRAQGGARVRVDFALPATIL